MSKLIVLEGPDGGGTTLQTKLLCENLRSNGFEVLQTAEPTDGIIGSEIRNMLHQDPLPPQDSIQLLFCADRAQHVHSVITPALQNGTVVVTDRYTLSTIVYGTAAGLDTSWLETINSNFPTPDITLVTMPPFEVCKARLGKRQSNDQFEKEDFQRKIYDTYVDLSKDSCIHIDTSGDIDDSSNEIWNHVNRMLQS